MEFLVKIKDKQGKQLKATIKANSLAEAHEKAIKKGFEIVQENIDDKTDTIEPQLTNQIMATKISNNQDEATTAEVEKAVIPSTEKRNKNRVNRKNTSKEGSLNKKARQNKNLSMFYIYMTLCPILLWFVYSVLHLVELSHHLNGKAFIILNSVIILISVICNLAVLFHGIRNSKRKIIWFSALFLMLNLYLLYRAGMTSYFVISLESEKKKFEKEYSSFKFEYGGKDLDFLYAVKLIDGKVYVNYIKSQNENDNSGPFIKNNKGEFIHKYDIGEEKLFKQDNDWYFTMIVKDWDPRMGKGWEPCRLLNGDILDKN